MPFLVEMLEFNILALWLILGLPSIILASLKAGVDWSERITLLLVCAFLWIVVLLILIGLILLRYPQ